MDVRSQVVNKMILLVDIAELTMILQNLVSSMFHPEKYITEKDAY